jgi:hypothetical protein
MEELDNALLQYVLDRTRASREKAAIAIYNHSTQWGEKEAEWTLLDILENASKRLHAAARDVLEEAYQLYC